MIIELTRLATYLLRSNFIFMQKCINKCSCAHKLNFQSIEVTAEIKCIDKVILKKTVEDFSYYLFDISLGSVDLR